MRGPSCPHHGPRGRPPWAIVGVVVLVLMLSLLALPSVGAPGLGDAPRAAAPPTSLPGSPSPSGASPAITIHIPHPTWINVTNDSPGAAPPPAYGTASAYDPESNETVYFGGCLGAGPCPDNQTWVFASGVWTNITNHKDSPSSREFAAMDYDANMHAILLFGGEGTDGVSLNDTWTFSNGTWTNVSWYSAAPPGRYGASLAFDPQPEENGSVLFGGLNGTEIFADTWAWESDAGWVSLDPSVSPGARADAEMAYDASDGYIVLFGGLYGFYLYTDTWELYSGQWWNVTPTTSPPGRAAGALVYVPSVSGVLLFGGLDDYGAANDTWTFSAGAWTGQAPSTSPPQRFFFDLALDGTGTTPIVQGGENATVYNDTWAYEFAPTLSVGPTVASGEVSQSVTFDVAVGSGTPPYQIALNFGDGTDAYLSGSGPTLSVSHTYARAGTFPFSASLTDAVGAKASFSGPTFSVSAGPAVTATADPSAGDVGLPVAFKTTVLSGGAGSLTYAWSFGDGTRGAGADPSHTYGAAGTYLVTLNATDADGASSTTSFELPVALGPTVALAATPASPGENVLTTFLATVTGGQGPYNYSWLLGNGARSALPAPEARYTSAGTYTVQVWVNDSAGGSAHASMTLTVPAPSGPLLGSLDGAPAWFWGGLAAIAVAGVGGFVLLLRRRP